MCWALLLAPLLLASTCGGAIQHGSTAVSAGGVRFLAKFCFDYSPIGDVAGTVNVSLRARGDSVQRARMGFGDEVYLLLLDDQDESYPEESDAWNAMSCTEKLRHGRRTWEILPAAAWPIGFETQVNIQEKVRPRWWYVAIADCTSSGFEADYTLHMWNPQQSWESEFSMDRRGMLVVCFAFLLVHGGIAAAQFHGNHLGQKRSAQADHPLVRLLSAEVSCAAAAALLLCAHYSRFASNGEGLPSFELLAKVLLWMSKCLVMCFVLLVSQGVCVSKPMTGQHLIHWLQRLGPFALMCLWLELWGEYAESRRYNTHFVYATGFGTLLVLVDLCWLLVYTDNLRRTHSAETDPKKRDFYATWGLAYGAWFLVLPVAALLSHLLAPWVCFRIAVTLINSCHALISVALVFALWPHRTNKTFKLTSVELVGMSEYEADEGKPLLT
eukprot:TRINITY_DN14408_c1_g3_i1.p1 TRINITY_DN14408_c1_g3~~TRINITY_DN14408_c1_g3_i1.p1  ORF type:complete len:441 (+),score=99.20 TRINITY_DN14408_c1_g3_i1:106-1428(+)